MSTDKGASKHASTLLRRDLGFLRATVAAFAVALLLPALRARAETRPVDARLVWVGDRVAYFAVADSSALERGDRVTLERHGKAVATGVVERIDPGGLAMARLESGSAGAEKQWKQIRVRADRAEGLAFPLLRLGVPSRSRPCAFFACAGSPPWIPRQPGYFTERESRDSSLLVRSDGARGAAAWPETLVIRPFDEAGDEEIALQRNEIDAGIFWPGELSSRLRVDPRWWTGERGSLEGVVAASVTGRDSATGPAQLPAADLAALDRELFRGDLELEGSGIAGGSAPRSGSRPRVIVDPSWPAASRIEAWWNRGAGTSSAGPAPRWQLARTGAVSADSLTAGLVTVPLFGIHCPVVAPAAMRARLGAIGLDQLVEPLDCPLPGTKP